MNPSATTSKRPVEPARVAIVRTSSAVYPAAPFSPPELFPEFRACGWLGQEVDASNTLYADVRRLLLALGLDAENAGTPRWNPLSCFVGPGQNTVIKPNLVVDSHPDGPSGVLGTVTHAAVMRPLVDYVLLATRGEGRITICDVPLQKANWERLIESSGLSVLAAWYRDHGVNIELLDCRREAALVNRRGVVHARRKLAGDPRGYVVVDLGGKSALAPIVRHSSRLEITDYGYGSVPPHHNERVNEYCIAKTMLEADFFLNVPKMKTHRKAGVTLALKNLIGINGDKSWIAHHRRGTPAVGGDEFPRIPLLYLAGVRLHCFLKTRGRVGVALASAMLAARRALGRRGGGSDGPLPVTGIITEGSWYGNDTLWRVILDLNAILRHADADGRLQDEPQRTYLAVCDGVIAGEREGPLEPAPRAAQVLAAGTNPVAVDLALAHLMGFDWRRIPQLSQAFCAPMFPLVDFAAGDVRVCGDYDTESWRGANLRLAPPAGWRGHIERTV